MNKQIKSENVVDLLEKVKEPVTCEKYLNQTKLEDFLLQLFWSKKELDSDGAFDSSVKIEKLNKPLTKYTLLAISKSTNEIIGEYDDIWELMEGINVGMDEARYLIEYSNRDFKTSKYKSYHLIKIECRKYRIKNNDYVLADINVRPYDYFNNRCEIDL